jgi:glycosyltransferase involved in cell wall biosynthesis
MEQKKIKILFFVPSFNGGGAEKVMSLLINNFNRNAYEIIVVTLHKAHNSYKVNASVYIELSANRVLFSGYSLNKIIQLHKPDFIFTTLTYVNTYIGLLDYIFRFDSILIARESTIPSVNNRRNRFSFLYDFLLRTAYKRFKLIVCQSHSMERDLNEKFGISNNKLLVIHNPVFETSLDNFIEKKSDLPIFLTVAMLRKEKGIDRIIDALALVNYDFRYIIVGDGRERKYLEKRVQDLNLMGKIKFMGFSKSPNEYYRSADVYLQGSYYEGFPNVILEAGMHGLPSLVFDSVGGTNELIKNNINGLVANGINEFAHSLNDLFWHQFDRNLIIEHTKFNYNSDLIIEKYQKIFQEK